MSTNDDEQRRELIEAAKEAAFLSTGPLALKLEEDGEKPYSVLRLFSDRGFDAGYDFALSPSVVHRIERAFAERVKARAKELNTGTASGYVWHLEAAMDAELKEDVKG